ncbi:MAG TPA: hypothetical protein VJS38_07130 [Phenylobacterium sp.]|uniref:hypothetical protein n=1 Tax=Phenylobacterium sp. TaxID=1871053 RepID=UPI002B46F165|nr:hypothetical protein [Phenylobacterium sp.]HKR87933.1 hypothetical protein [Phenylobacterium sp.]
MIKFSASEAALEGFRLTRERPGTIFGWGLVYAVCMFVIGRLMLVSLDPQLIELTRKKGLEQQDIDQISGLLAQSWPAFLLVLVLVTALLSTLMGGIYRLVLRPGEKGFLHLRFGKDELRLTGVNLLLFALGMVCLTAELAAVAAADQQGGIAAVAALMLPLVTIWAGVRLSLATPMSFALHRFAIRDAWAASQGKFWALFGMIVLAVIFYVMVWLLISIIGAALIGVAGGAQALDNIKGLSGPAIIGVALYVFLQLILQVIQVVMLYAPFAVAYQQVHGDPPANPLRVRPQDS